MESFHLECHTLEFFLQTQKLDAYCVIMTSYKGRRWCELRDL